MNGFTFSWFRKHPFASFALVTTLLATAVRSSTPRIPIGSAELEQAVELPLTPLSSLSVPKPVGGDIIDQAAAVRLGKALFWDIQVGGDGQTACATCHFHGGADNRTFSALNPGPDKIFASGGVTGPGQNFAPSNIEHDDRATSPALPQLAFVKVDPDPRNAADICTPGVSPIFGTSPQATVRNAPTTVNGIAFFRQLFWDGSGSDTFNGVNKFGATANNNAAATNPALTSISNSALASQAVGPANKFPEVSCNGRTFGNLYDKLTARKVLQHQLVHQHDSALGPMSAWPAKGLKCGTDGHACGYGEMIAAAFGPSLAVKGQFSRVFGQAVQAYESTLIPDQTPFDKHLSGHSKAMTDLQKKGLSIFRGKGGCTKCHAGAELTDASWSVANRCGRITEDGGDQGFHNIGVRPTAEDLGRAGTGGANAAPFSESGSIVDHGAFKTPALRNVGLTAPYFHTGGKATLEDVVDFYNRGGDFANTEKARRIRPLGLSASDKAALVEFLRNGLTDCRTANDEAPFDHPSLTVHNGPDLPATGGGSSCR